MIINDSTPLDGFQASSVLCGCLPRRERYGSLACAAAKDIDLIPWEEMPDRIADQERNKSSLFHIWQDSKIGVLNQNPLSYCWNFSSVEALMLYREIMGLPYVSLSPSSVGAPLVNYQNTGYYIEEALKAMVSQGAASTEYVPATTTRRNDFKLGWKESAAGNKVTNWADVGTNAQKQLTMLLTDRPLVTAHNWWGHAILHLQVIDRNPSMPANNPMRYGRKFLNSWGKDWGDGGCGILEGQRAIADAAYAIEQASFVE